MAQFSSSTFGTISGRHGTAVAATTKDGRSILKIYRAPSNPNTQKQQAQRAKFALVTSELSSYQNLFKSTFLDKNGRLKATSLALANAVVGEYPNYVIDYSKVRLAEGKMDTAEKISIEIISGSNVRVSWDTTVDGTESAPTDTVCLVFINTTSMVAVHKVDETLRINGTVDIALSDVWSGMDVYCWMYFRNAESTETSNSQFLGKIKL